jgi:hypothetical protein
MTTDALPDGYPVITERLRSIEARLTGNAPTHRRIIRGEQTERRFKEFIKSFDQGNRDMPDEDIVFHQRIFYSLRLLEKDVDAALFIKRCALRELTRSAIDSLEQQQILVMFTLFRPIIEQVAFVSSFLDDFEEMDTEKTVAPPFKRGFDRNAGEELAWSQLNLNFAKKLFPKNADVGKLLRNELAPNSDLPWRKKDGTLDHKAEGTSRAVDRLGKKISGVVRLYKLASEFAHPNSAVGVIFQAEPRCRLSPPLTEYDEVIYSMYQSGRLLWPKIEESLHVVVTVLEMFLENEERLKVLSKKAQKQSLKYLRTEVRHFRKKGVDFVTGKDPCPCLSGKVFGACCGRGL